tara:strand:- start:63 stop:1922 length:1860 start_codon:yes stop_codon:yes gene_type:complete
MIKISRGIDKNIDIDKRMIIIDHDKCKPKTPVYDYLVSKSKICDKECIIIDGDKINMSDESCMMCFNLAKRSPGNAIKIVKLPKNLQTNITYCYGQNLFKLHGLPMPHPGSVLGILGTNGIGKSTAINILSGNIIPNFGKLDKEKPTKKEIINYYRGCELQNYFNKLYKNNLRISIKPQDINKYIEEHKNINVEEFIKCRDERHKMNEICKKLELLHLFDRSINNLSGGELQRLMIAVTILKNADIYFFDECSSFLDVKQRIIVTEIIRDLLNESEWDSKVNINNKYVVVIEHDLAILDYMSDYIQSLYGKPGAFGVVTSKASTSNGINQFLEGYIKSENIKFRPYELSFKNNFKNNDITIKKNLEMKYPKMTKEYKDSSFRLNIDSGSFFNKEIVCLMGENGCGKSTFINLLAYNLQNSKFLPGTSISFKPQYIEFDDFCGTVQDLLEKKINSSLGNRNFRLIVLNSLKINSIKDLKVKNLSGGQKQRVAITICLGTPAKLYLIDEPSAGLDCEQRIIVAKVIQKYLVEFLGKTCFLIEHDFLMTSTIADKIILFEGKPGLECKAKTPSSLIRGFNDFLKNLNITFRRDPNNFRPRINKKNSNKDKKQKSENKYFYFD